MTELPDKSNVPRPWLLDLCCGVGGASEGYRRAGFRRIVGVDLRPQPRYPFEFHQGDVLEWLESGWVAMFDAVHVSAPCHRYSSITRVTGRHEEHPDLIGPVRERLEAIDVPWIMENVPRAPLVDPVTVCGVALGRMIVDHDGEAWLRRHRLFESNVPLSAPPCQCRRGSRRILGVYGGGTRQWTRRGNQNGGNTDKANLVQARGLMGITWANRRELTQAIPPAYTELLGVQLLGAIVDRFAAAA